MRKLSTKASKASDVAKNKKVASMKAKRKVANSVEKMRGLQRSGSMQGKSASYNSKTKTYKMK